MECTEAEGPGRRFALWTQGCPLRCPGCCNPEMLSFEGGDPWPVERLVRRVHAAPDLEGLTLVGGEPFAQAEACARLATEVRRMGLTVMAFSGYTLEELRASTEVGVAPLLASLDLLVDGRFDRALPEERRRWVGSQNQRVHVLTERYRADDPRFAQPNTCEIKLNREGLRVSGWPGLTGKVIS